MSLRNLNKDDVKMLKSKNYNDNDIKQIDEAVGKTIYTISTDQYGKESRISAKKARELLGSENFISGISRSAFHWGSVRECKDSRLIFFDSSKLFK